MSSCFTDSQRTWTIYSFYFYFVLFFVFNVWARIYIEKYCISSTAKHLYLSYMVSYGIISWNNKVLCRFALLHSFLLLCAAPDPVFKYLLLALLLQVLGRPSSNIEQPQDMYYSWVKMWFPKMRGLKGVSGVKDFHNHLLYMSCICCCPP